MDILSEMDANGYANTQTYEDITFLVSTGHDMNFLLEYLGTGKLFLETMKYREKVIKSLNLTLQEFTDKFEQDKKTALEELLQHRIDNLDIELLEDKLTKTLTLCKLYHKHKQNRNYYLLRLLMSA